jgi:hypothetical protein
MLADEPGAMQKPTAANAVSAAEEDLDGALARAALQVWRSAGGVGEAEF